MTSSSRSGARSAVDIAGRAAGIDALVDEASMESFPASDPLRAGVATRARPTSTR
jgi:hypothetical protein